MASLVTAVLAHQGNWDEILMFAVPILIAVGAVRWAERRNRERSEAEEAGASVRSPGGSDDDAE